MSPAIILAGHRFEPLPSGALWWPARATLIVADLHFEKGSAVAARRGGALLPPYDTAATIARLADAIERQAPRLVISLGDAFHDRHGPERMTEAERRAIAGLARGRDWYWVAGNHDAAARPPGGSTVPELTVEGIAFRHEPLADSAGPEIVGHYHPKAAVRTARGRVSGRCFAGDARRLVLPAFGAYAGGLDVLHPAIRCLFAERFAVGLIGRRGVHAFPGETLVPIAA